VYLTAKARAWFAKRRLFRRGEEMEGFDPLDSFGWRHVSVYEIADG